jgi:hypothetical protein
MIHGASVFKIPGMEWLHISFSVLNKEFCKPKIPHWHHWINQIVILLINHKQKG